MASDIVVAIARRLAERAGLELPAWVVEARAATRMEALALPAADYVQLIESSRGGAELDELIEAVRVGETRLFRHRAQIAALVDVIAPALRASRKRTIRVWSAGCAAGEEPYTLALVLARALPGVQLSIAATDVSADALAIAQIGAYRASALADVPEEYRDGFVSDGELIRLRPELAALVRFERANLVDGAAPRQCDLVWCRNVLIYFTPDARRRAIERLVAATVPGGYLFVGYSETLRDIAALDAMRSGETVYYVRRDGTAEAPRRPTPPPVARRPLPSTVPPPDAANPWRNVRDTPPPMRIPATPPPIDVLALRGHPDARTLTAELTVRLAVAGLQKLVIDLDAAELLADDLAPVLRRARAASAAAHVVLELRATRTGTRRWLARHGLADSATGEQP
ncbi:MAG: hypothetical protein H0T89_05690 [Deltaproteobacteria bacterium]|nr:hypothetical protein [Deltaproteobacteria bacterium]